MALRPVHILCPDRKEASCKGSPWEREACFRKVLYGCAPGKTGCCRLWRQVPSSVLDCRRREKSRFYPRKFLWMPGGHRQAWLIVESGLLYLLDRNEGRENPFKRAWKGAERERRRVACHADEQACSRYVWRRMLPPGGTSASRPPWPCFSNGTYFP